MNLIERVAMRALQVGTPFRAAATYLAKVADQDKSAPKKVDDLFKEVKDGNPGYTDEQAWATAWSIYCKHVDPNGEHCQKSPGGYLKEANDTAKVRTLLAKSIKNMKDIRSSHWEGFETKTPELARRTVQMAAEDALQAMEAADKLLAGMKLAANDLKPGDKVEVVKHKKIQGLDYFGHTGKVTAVGMPGAPHMVTVAIDHPVHAMLGPAPLPADILKKVGSVVAGAEGSIERPTPSAEAEGSIERPTPMAVEEAPDESHWNPWEKRGEWNLTIYHPGGRRNLSYFMKNPSGGGGGSNDGTSVSALIKMVIHQTGWAVPHINPHKKDKVWVAVVQPEGEDGWKAIKQYWEPIPKELLVPKMPRQLTKEEQMDLLTR